MGRCWGQVSRERQKGVASSATEGVWSRSDFAHPHSYAKVNNMKMRLITMGIAVFVFSTSSILAVDFKPAAGGQQIVATGLTPGGTTIWIGLARIPVLLKTV